MTTFSKLTPGLTLYDCHTYGMGNATMRAMDCWDVKIISVDSEKKTAVVSWNGNAPMTMRERELSRLRASPIEWLRDPLDGDRCYFCREKRQWGHAENCQHPKAVAARKKDVK